MPDTPAQHCPECKTVITPPDIQCQHCGHILDLPLDYLPQIPIVMTEAYKAQQRAFEQQSAEEKEPRE